MRVFFIQCFNEYSIDLAPKLPKIVFQLKTTPTHLNNVRVWTGLNQFKPVPGQKVESSNIWLLLGPRNIQRLPKLTKNLELFCRRDDFQSLREKF